MTPADLTMREAAEVAHAPGQGKESTMCSFSSLVGAAFVSVTMALPAWAQVPISVEQCRLIPDDAKRLACYDKLAALARPSTLPPSAHGYQAVSLTDLKLDYDSLRGLDVEVSGNLILSGEMALLASGTTDTSPLLVDLKAVPRDQRRALLERCMVPGCTVTMRGKVDRMMEQRAIVADGAAIE